MKIFLVVLFLGASTTPALAESPSIKTKIAIVDNGGGGRVSGENSLHCRFWC